MAGVQSVEAVAKAKANGVSFAWRQEEARAQTSVPSGLWPGSLDESTRGLSIWISERRLCKEQLIVHKCTSRFPSWVLSTFMPEWEWHALLRPDGPEEAWSGVAGSGSANPNVPKAASTCCGRYSRETVISQRNFGWPESRPRLYHVGVLKADGFLRAPGLQLLNQLRERVELDVTCLFTAPEEPMCLFP